MGNDTNRLGRQGSQGRRKERNGQTIRVVEYYRKTKDSIQRQRPILPIVLYRLTRVKRWPFISSRKGTQLCVTSIYIRPSVHSQPPTHSHPPGFIDQVCCTRALYFALVNSWTGLPSMCDTCTLCFFFYICLDMIITHMCNLTIFVHIKLG